MEQAQKNGIVMEGFIVIMICQPMYTRVATKHGIATDHGIEKVVDRLRFFRMVEGNGI